MNHKKIFIILFVSLFLSGAGGAVMASTINIVYQQSGNIQITNPENSQLFYDQLSGKPRDYFIDFSAQGGPASGWDLYINLMVPEVANTDGRYSAKVYSENISSEQQVALLDGNSIDWKEYYESYGRDYYLKGPELTQHLLAGKYKIEVYSTDLTTRAGNQGKYVLAVGDKESFDAQSILNIYWQLPLLKLKFFKTSVLEFFLTPFGIAGIAAVGALIIIILLLYYLVGTISLNTKHSQAKTLLLTSSGMQMKNEIIKLLQKPSYDISVAFITTAAKPEQDLSYLQNDWSIMKDEIKFNVEEIDIEGKTEVQVAKLLQFKDIIFVEGGNTFYLLKAMRACNFEKIIRKLLQEGKVYIGASAGSIVAGKTIQTAGWLDKSYNNRNSAGLKDLKGLNLVPFDIFVHYQPENAEIIKQKMPNAKQRLKDIKILTDSHAILVQGKQTALIGEGEAVVI